MTDKKVDLKQIACHFEQSEKSFFFQTLSLLPICCQGLEIPLTVGVGLA
jgi:hypothetical protein